mmetsp:Transcript_23684/g.50206  ORF Transcript_23684/g.50206 Transcript_23684/m.50206 type:complete len:250 (+) Transcript_23684:750-1499(+)
MPPSADAAAAAAALPLFRTGLETHILLPHHLILHHPLLFGFVEDESVLFPAIIAPLEVGSVHHLRPVLVPSEDALVVGEGCQSARADHGIFVHIIGCDHAAGGGTFVAEGREALALDGEGVGHVFAEGVVGGAAFVALVFGVFEGGACQEEVGVGFAVVIVIVLVVVIVMVVAGIFVIQRDRRRSDNVPAGLFENGFTAGGSIGTSWIILPRFEYYIGFVDGDFLLFFLLGSIAIPVTIVFVVTLFGIA